MMILSFLGFVVLLLGIEKIQLRNGGRNTSSLGNR